MVTISFTLNKKMERLNTNPHIISLALAENKYFPNSKLPVLIYKQVCALPAQKNKAASIVQKIFLRNNWSNSWRNGIYNFHHYHSNTHECMAICFGKVKVILGGPNGKRIELEQGDVIVLPAGVGHKCSSSSEDFLCVGAYPKAKDYDINHGTKEELKRAKENIQKVGLPSKDPLFGKEGFLKSFWK